MAFNFVVAICSFVAGIFLGSVFSFTETWLLGFIVVVLFLSFCFVVIFSKKLALAVLVAAFFTLSGHLFIEGEFAQSKNEYSSLVGQSINTEGVVVSDPVVSDVYQDFELVLDGFTQRVQVRIYGQAYLRYGDRVWVRGELELPENFSEFDYIGFLAKGDVYARLKKSQVITIDSEVQFFVYRKLFAIRHAITTAINKKFEENKSGVIAGMLIGQRSSIPKQLKEDFAISGMTHILAVSGYNMTIIATSMGIFSWYIGRRWTGVLTVLVTLGFVVVSGATAAVVRSALMALLIIASQYTQRMYLPLYGLAWAVFFMVLHNPRIVFWDVGFQLSVVATIGVVVSHKLIKKDVITSNILSNILLPTFGATIMTLPIIAFHFGTVSIFSLVANLVLLPFVPWIMLFGALSLIPFFGFGFALIENFLLSGLIKGVEFFASLPLSSVEVSISAAFVFLYYGIVIMMYQMLMNTKNTKLIDDFDYDKL